jgi:hypothetical protein
MKKKQWQTGKKKHSLIQSVGGEDPCRVAEQIGCHVLKQYEVDSLKQQSDLCVAKKPKQHSLEWPDVPFAHSPTDGAEVGALPPDFSGAQSGS